MTNGKSVDCNPTKHCLVAIRQVRVGSDRPFLSQLVVKFVGCERCESVVCRTCSISSIPSTCEAAMSQSFPKRRWRQHPSTRASRVSMTTLWPFHNNHHRANASQKTGRTIIDTQRNWVKSPFEIWTCYSDFRFCFLFLCVHVCVKRFISQPLTVECIRKMQLEWLYTQPHHQCV